MTRKDDKAFASGILKRLQSAKRDCDVALDKGEVRRLIDIAQSIFDREPMLLEVDAPVNVCGDTHGQFRDLLHIFETVGWPPKHRFLFLGFVHSNRGASYSFGEEEVKRFCNDMGVGVVLRAHQVVDGLQYFADYRLVTIFSAPNYCNQFTNSAGVLQIDRNLVCRPRTLKSS